MKIRERKALLTFVTGETVQLGKSINDYTDEREEKGSHSGLHIRLSVAFISVMAGQQVSHCVNCSSMDGWVTGLGTE